MPDEIDELRREIRVLREELRSALDVDERSYYFSKAPLVGDESATGIPHMGMPLLDNANFERLAEVCAETGRYECLLTIAPLVGNGGTGSPVNPIATF